MSKTETLKKRVEALSPEELGKFRDWFNEFDAQLWDRQFEADANAGKLDRLVNKSPYEIGKDIFDRQEQITPTENIARRSKKLLHQHFRVKSL